MIGQFSQNGGNFNFASPRFSSAVTKWISMKWISMKKFNKTRTVESMKMSQL